MRIGNLICIIHPATLTLEERWLFLFCFCYCLFVFDILNLIWIIELNHVSFPSFYSCINISYKIGKHLLKFGKIHYRHIYPLPFQFEERKQDIISKSNRYIYYIVYICTIYYLWYDTRLNVIGSSSQIRRSVKSWMIAPTQETLQEYRKREIGWDHNSTSSSKQKEKDETLLSIGNLCF